MQIKTKILIIFTLLTLSCFTVKLSKDSHQPLKEQKEPTSIFTKYDSYNPRYLVEYEKTYQKTTNYIYSLNLVNYPTFLNLDSENEAITIEGILLLNPKYYVSKDYVPDNLKPITTIPHIKRKNEVMYLDKNCLKALTNLFKESQKQNLKLTVFSAYRSFEKQTRLYNNAKNKAYVAKPGHSEHHSGLSVDISTVENGLTSNFDKTSTFTFLENNAHKFGFILRYPKNKEHITGYNYEPWHYRYVGVSLACKIYESNLTLEEYIYQNYEL